MTQNNSSQWMPLGAAKFKRYESIYLVLSNNSVYINSENSLDIRVKSQLRG
jgi:hypothetical protein